MICPLCGHLAHGAPRKLRILRILPPCSPARSFSSRSPSKPRPSGRVAGCSHGRDAAGCAMSHPALRSIHAAIDLRRQPPDRATRRRPALPRMDRSRSGDDRTAAPLRIQRRRSQRRQAGRDEARHLRRPSVRAPVPVHLAAGEAEAAEVPALWEDSLMARTLGRAHWRRWAQLRKQVFDSVNWRCERCGDLAQELHHRDCDRSNDDLGNLEAICTSCHVLEHDRLRGQPQARAWRRLVRDLR